MDGETFGVIFFTLCVVLFLSVLFLWNNCQNKEETQDIHRRLDFFGNKIEELQTSLNRIEENQLDLESRIESIEHVLERELSNFQLMHQNGPPPPYPGPRE